MKQVYVKFKEHGEIIVRKNLLILTVQHYLLDILRINLLLLQEVNQKVLIYQQRRNHFIVMIFLSKKYIQMINSVDRDLKMHKINKVQVISHQVLKMKI